LKPEVQYRANKLNPRKAMGPVIAGFFFCAQPEPEA
jgi:hypothetical protein